MSEGLPKELVAEQTPDGKSRSCLGANTEPLRGVGIDWPVGRKRCADLHRSGRVPA